MNKFLLDNIVNAIPYPSMLLDSTLNVKSANTPARALFGDSLEGQDVVRALRQADALDCINTAIKTKQLVRCNFVLKLQTSRTYEASAAVINVDKSNNEIVLFTLNDISAELDAEKSRSTFVANVSHELRSPLTSLMGIVETLKGPARNDEAARDKFLELMQGETGRMSRLVGDLLSLSKLEAKEHLPPEGDVNVLRLVHHIMTVLSESTPSYKNRVRIHASDDLPILTADLDELTEVFQNLIENALKYSTPNTPVQVSITREAERMIITIRDQGDGIAPKHLPRLTERFYRADKGRSRDMGGTGLGLAITKHILNRHRAKLNIDSELNVGTIVTVSLPL